MTASASGDLGGETAGGRDDWEAHWSEYADAASDNPAQEFRRRVAFALLEADATPCRLLDIGSGQGDLLKYAHDRWPAAALLGIELSSAGVAESQRKVPTAEFVQADLILRAPDAGEHTRWATHAVCSEVLEHVDDPALLLRNVCAFLAPGCRVVITVPAGPRSAFDVHIGHRRHFTIDSLNELLAAAGLEVQEVRGGGFPTFNLYKLLVIARGQRLVEEAKRSTDASPSRIARATMKAFRPLFRLTVPRSRWGWQLFAVAHTPE